MGGGGDFLPKLSATYTFWRVFCLHFLFMVTNFESKSATCHTGYAIRIRRLYFYWVFCLHFSLLTKIPGQKYKLPFTNYLMIYHKTILGYTFGGFLLTLSKTPRRKMEKYYAVRLFKTKNRLLALCSKSTFWERKPLGIFFWTFYFCPFFSTYLISFFKF